MADRYAAALSDDRHLASTRDVTVACCRVGGCFLSLERASTRWTVTRLLWHRLRRVGHAVTVTDPVTHGPIPTSPYKEATSGALSTFLGPGRKEASGCALAGPHNASLSGLLQWGADGGCPLDLRCVHGVNLTKDSSYVAKISATSSAPAPPCGPSS
jgi:hypothetical protein